VSAASPNDSGAQHGPPAAAPLLAVDSPPGSAEAFLGAGMFYFSRALQGTKQLKETLQRKGPLDVAGPSPASLSLTAALHALAREADQTLPSFFFDDDIQELLSTKLVYTDTSI
jgi:hypothetical protein